ncbi:MAG: hypothetical protein ACYTGB_00370 [Planctomycetota bacterium]|jgi:hypothetical protein
MRTAFPVLTISLIALSGCSEVNMSARKKSAANTKRSSAAFAEKPSAVREGSKVRISFAARRATDCAVWIVDAKGRPVRHLAAGVLGKDAPAPLKKSSLRQELVWDGRDDRGKAVLTPDTRNPAPFRVRVGLGSRARFERVIGREEQWLGEIYALAAGKGKLYAFCSRGIVVLDRSGKYLKQIVPAPPDLPLSKLKGLGPVKLPGGGACFSREYGIPGKMKYVASMALTPQGQLLLPSHAPYARSLARIGIDGSVAADAFDTKLTMLADCGYLHLACSPDGKTLYLSGAEAGYRGDDARKVCYRQVVYRLNLAGRGPAEILTGDDENSGGPGFYVDRPKGVACDSKGNVYVCNYGADNICVYSPRGGLLRSFKVKNPQAVAVHPKTGQVYVLAGKELGYEKYGYAFEATLLESRLLRFGPEGKLERQKKLPDAYVRGGKTRTGPSYQLRFAADFSGGRPVIWLGVASPSAREAKYSLLRVEDGPAGFGAPRDVCPQPAEALIDGPLQLALDRENDVLYVHDACRRLLQSRLVRYSGDGKALPPLLLGKKGEEPYNFSEIAFGPDGLIYTTAWQGLWGGSSKTTLMRFTRSGEPVPFPAGSDERRLIRSMKGARGASSRGLTVAPNGEIYVLYYDRKRPEKGRQPWEAGWDLSTALARFSAEGKLLDPHLVAYLRAGAQCVRVDLDGSVYVGDNTMPIGTSYPREIARGLPDPFKRDYVARLESGSLDPLLRWMGSVFKFAARGGKVTGLPEGDRTAPARAPRGDLWKPVPPVQWFLHNSQRVRMTGAEWQFHGFAPVPVQYQGVTHVERCVCRAGRFDLDEFGRLFVPDALRHRVTVLDAAGNQVARFGRYGNADSAGPEIGLSDPWWIAAASDRVYVGERDANRIVKVRLESAASTECAIE